MQDDPTNEQEHPEPSRRRFLKAAAATGVAGAVWSEPLIRGIPAYAADAASVVGSVAGQFISWSPNRDNWDNTTSMAIVQSPDLAMGVCGTSASYTVTLDTMATISLTALGNPDGPGNTSNDRDCTGAGSSQFPGLISLEPQTGCMFTDGSISVSDGSFMLVNNGTRIEYTNTGNSGLQMINFSIMCG